MLGLLLIVGSGWMLFKTITAFTIAHSITLAVATLGYASAPLPPLNAAIALSILFLGPEIVRAWRGQTSLTLRYPWVVAFALGLLHGSAPPADCRPLGWRSGKLPGHFCFSTWVLRSGRCPLCFISSRWRGHTGNWRFDGRAGPWRCQATPSAAWVHFRYSTNRHSPRQHSMRTQSSKIASQKIVLWVVLLAAVATPSNAWAHIQAGEAGGFVSGFHHPISGLDHVVAMVAVGLWGAQLGAPAMWLLPVAFPMVMAFGGMMGLLGIPLPGVEIGIALSAVVLGLMDLGEKRPPVWIAALIVGIFAIFHGHAHGTELPPGESGLLYSAGFVIATGCLHAVGITIGLIYRWTTGRVVIRLAGATVAMAGSYFLFSALT